MGFCRGDGGPYSGFRAAAVTARMATTMKLRADVTKLPVPRIEWCAALAALLVAGCDDGHRSVAFQPPPEPAEPVVSEWTTDFAAAKERASRENRAIFLQFTGSDWCSPCIMFDKVVLSHPEFIAYARKRLVLVVVDFPRKRPLPQEIADQNEALKKLYDVRGFPTSIIVDATGRKLGHTGGYNASTEGPEDCIRNTEALLLKEFGPR